MSTSRAALVSARIRSARQARGWSLADVARMLASTDTPLAVGQLSKIELGKRGLSIDELSALAAILDTVPEYLMRNGEVCTACGQEVPQ